MSTEIQTINREIANRRQQLSSVIGLVRSANTPEAVQDLRAKTEAVKAWAKVHKQTKGFRLDFLRIEVEALVRLAELDGLDMLAPSEADAAKYLAGLSQTERDALISDAGNVTTAAGLVRAWQRDKAAAAKHRAETKSWARRFSSDDAYPDVDEFDESELVRHRKRIGWYESRARFAEVIEHYTGIGEPFTVQDVTDSFVDGTGLGDEIEEHPALEAGLREVARKAINASPPEMWGDTIIPKIITSLVPTDDGSVAYVRIPVMSAKVRDVEEMVAMREEQLKQDIAALDRLREFRDRLLAAGGDLNSNVGAILLAEINRNAA